MIGEIISPLTDEETKELERLKLQLLSGVELSVQSTGMIVASLMEIHEKRLYRDYGTFYEWCERFIGLSARQVNNYLRSDGTTKQVKAADATFEDHLPVTYSMQLDKVEEKDQGKLWNAAKERAKESGDKFTGKLIATVARELVESGEIHLRDGVKLHNPTHSPHTPERIRQGWFELTLGDKSEVFNHLVKNETENSLRWMKGMIERELEQYEPDDNGDDNS